MSKIFGEYSFVNNKPPLKSETSKSKWDKKKKINFEKANISLFNEILEEEIALEELEEKEEKYQGKELETIEKLLKDIGRQGEILKKSRSLEDLDKYKKMIKNFLKEIIDRIEKKERKSLWDKRKKEKIMKVHITIINKELEELTRIFFDEQQNILAIASQIDKIEGILIDLIS